MKGDKTNKECFFLNFPTAISNDGYSMFFHEQRPPFMQSTMFMCSGMQALHSRMPTPYTLTNHEKLA